MHKIAMAFCSILLLTACQQSSKVKPANPLQLVDFTHVNSYSFAGKMSFSDGRDGGSGRVKWSSDLGRINASLKAPLGSKSWEVKEYEQFSELTASNGQVLTAASTATLISEQLGWAVPWHQLSAWVTGQQFNSSQSQVIWEDGGFTILEDGWEIQYSKLMPHEEGVLPYKMVARKGEYAIKLSVKSWQW